VRILVSGSTRTVGRLAAAWGQHLGLLETPACGHSLRSILAVGLPWGIDNGAYSGFDADAFRRLLRRAARAPGLLWVVCPDCVGDARGTLARWREWEPELRAAGVPVAFVLQDGQERCELPAADSYFVGGSTRWKLSEAAGDLAGEAKRRGALLHMGRVNSLRRLALAHDLGCDSVDGTKVSRWEGSILRRFLAYCRRLDGLPSLF
jgi:hypothetical protein